MEGCILTGLHQVNLCYTILMLLKNEIQILGRRGVTANMTKLLSNYTKGKKEGKTTNIYRSFTKCLDPVWKHLCIFLFILPYEVGVKVIGKHIL